MDGRHDAFLITRYLFASIGVLVQSKEHGLQKKVIFKVDGVSQMDELFIIAIKDDLCCSVERPQGVSSKRLRLDGKHSWRMVWIEQTQEPGMLNRLLLSGGGEFVENTSAEARAMRCQHRKAE